MISPSLGSFTMHQKPSCVPRCVQASTTPNNIYRELQKTIAVQVRHITVCCLKAVEQVLQARCLAFSWSPC